MTIACNPLKLLRLKDPKISSVGASREIPMHRYTFFRLCKRDDAT